MQVKKKSIVQPTVTFGDDKQHVVAELLDSENPPVITSIGYMRVPNKNTFVAYTIKSKGREILSIEVEEPNLRMIAEDSAKMFFVSNFCQDLE